MPSARRYCGFLFRHGVDGFVVNANDVNMILVGSAAVLAAGAEFGNMLRRWRRADPPDIRDDDDLSDGPS